MTKFEQINGDVHLSTDQHCTVRAKKVVFAMGYESQQYLRQQVAKLISTFAFVSEPVKKSDFSVKQFSVSRRLLGLSGIRFCRALGSFCR